MPVNNNTDLQFYQNVWIHKYLHTVCDYNAPGCSIACNESSTWASLAEKTRCISRAIRNPSYPKVDYYIKLDDDAFVDRQYVFDLMEKYRRYRQPVYISDFILDIDRHKPVLNGTFYGNGKFYMFNRRLLECLDTDIRYRGQRNEDAVFGAMVRSGCGPNVLRVAEDDTKLSLRNIALAVFLCLLIVELVFVAASFSTNGRLNFIPYGFGRAEPHKESLAVIMPVNKKTDMQFYRNMWLGDYLHTVCDFAGPECTLSCNAESTYKTLDKKTICFTDILKKSYKDINFFIKLDDDALVDKGYVLEMIEKYKDYKEPVYISDFILNLDGQKVLNGSYYGNGKFYMFNRALVNCIDTKIKYKGNRNEDAVFGAMVYNGCGPDVLKVPEDDSRIWHKVYSNKNKKIDLSALTNH
ncbi:hypothetical protein LPJ64_003406 [Coemansia asiatica]|uniref:Hexosyltransferase n=1 Tax=Coemansia asiatica TaxID=1052880 RepID=A0A9W8CK19_9FUNG|nr:hypothetical protein LPJ64_003406 [Coemansia asiatica]